MVNWQSGAQGKRFALRLTLAVFLTVPTAIAQTNGDISHFDVASVRVNNERVVGPGECRGGPGTQSPTLWICEATNVFTLIRSAFALDLYQFSPSQDWIVTSRYSISARLPPGATREQFREMQRNLLTVRFGFAWHWKESDATVYRLVRDPGGIKLHESAPDAAPATVIDYSFPRGTALGDDRYPVLPEGISALVGMGNHNRWRASNVTTEDMAWVLRHEFKTDVTDETGLTGHYDVDLRWQTPEEIGSAPYDGPDVKTEFRNQLGLRIESAKGKIRTFVVDHMDKVPTEN